MSLLTFLRDNAPFLAAGVLLTLMSSFGQTFFISVFAGDIRAAFDLSHGAWGAIYAVGTTASAAAMVWAGILTDRVRVRILGPATLVLLAVSCALMSLVPGPAFLVPAIFLLRFAGQGMATHIAVVAMGRWFAVSRGRALSVAISGVSIGEAFVPIIFVSLLGIFDWRSLWLVAAVVPLAAIPILLPLLRLERTPQAIAAEAQALGMLNRHWSRVEMIRHPLFWLVVPAVLAPPAFGTSFFFQQVHLASVKGWAHADLAALFPVFTGAALVGIYGSGVAIDRLGTARLMPVFQIPMAVGFLLLSAADGLGLAAVAVACLGLTQGMAHTIPNAFWAEFYGTRHLGAIKSLATAFMVFGTALGPGLTGLLIDLGVAFPAQMPGIAAYFVLAAGSTWFGVSRARPSLPAPPEVDIVSP